MRGGSGPPSVFYGTRTHPALCAWQISKDSVVEDANLYAEAKLFAESIQAGKVNVQHVREDESTSDDVPF